MDDDYKQKENKFKGLYSDLQVQRLKNFMSDACTDYFTKEDFDKGFKSMERLRKIKINFP